MDRATTAGKTTDYNTCDFEAELKALAPKAKIRKGVIVNGQINPSLWGINNITPVEHATLTGQGLFMYNVEWHTSSGALIAEVSQLPSSSVHSEQYEMDHGGSIPQNEGYARQMAEMNYYKQIAKTPLELASKLDSNLKKMQSLDGQSIRLTVSSENDWDIIENAVGEKFGVDVILSSDRSKKRFILIN